MSPAKKSASKSRSKTTAVRKSANVFTAEERAAVRDYVREKKAQASRGSSTDKEEGEKEVREKIAAMPQPDRAMAERLHTIIKAAAPSLTSRTWYGMPAYAKDGNVVCFFQNSRKFKTRYSTLGFSDKARIVEGRMWPVAYAVMELTPAEESRITA